MKAPASKKPATPAKKSDSFFGKEGKQPFFGAQAPKNQFFKGGAPGGTIQPKLTVGQPNDIYEKEADSMADKVVQKLSEPGKEKVTTPVDGASSLQTKPIFESKTDPKEEPIQRKPSSSSTPAATPSVESGINSSKGGGSPLPAATRKQMESGLGADFSGVRIHNGSSARQMSKDLNAQAFTHGKDIYFNSGKYDTQSTGGKHLLAHELTHVVQQNKGVARKPDISKKAATGTSATTSATGTVTSTATSTTTSAASAAASTSAAAADSTPIQRTPMIQMDGDPGGKDIKDMDDAAITALGTAKEGFIKKADGKTQIHFKDFPSKQYATPFLTKDDKGNEYISSPPFLKPTGERKTKQGYVWRKNALPLVKDTLTDFITRKNVKGPSFLLTVKNSKDIAVTGNADQIAAQVVVPPWGLDGKGIKFQIEHKVDWQIAGGNHDVDVISNLILLDAAENLRIGQVVLDSMKKYYSKIIAYYKGKQVTGLEESFDAGKGVYPIYSDNLVSDDQAVHGSLISISNMDKGKTLNPLSENLVDVQDESLKPGQMVLRTSFSGAGNIVTYNFSNDFLKIDGDAANHTLTSITLFNVVKDAQGNLDLANPNKKLDFTRESQDHYKVKTEGYAALLKDCIRGMKNMSPIDWSEVDFNPLTGWQATGKVDVQVPFLQGADISINLENSIFTLQAAITSDALKDKLPKPFQIDYSSLFISASSLAAFAIGGEVGFSIEKYGKGHIGGSAGTEGFQVHGGFEFDKKYFTSSVTVSYKKVGANEIWKIDGSVDLKKGVIKNVNTLHIDVSYDGKTLAGNGTATLSLPGVKSIGIKASVDDSGNMMIGGTFDLGKLPKVKGGTGSITVTKTADDWDIDLTGKVQPDLAIDALKIDEVDISYHKGIFDISTGAHFKKGKIGGDFTVGVTNSAVSADGKKTGADGGKTMNFYAAGQIKVDIIEGVGGLIDVKIKPDGDILMDGKVMVTQDKPLFTMEPLNKNIFTLDKNIPLASCVVVTLSLHFGGSVDIYANLNPLTFDKGSYIGLSNVSLKDFSHPTITSHLSVSSHLDAGITLELKLGLDASLLGILHANVLGTGTLDFRAIEAALNLTFDAEWSPQEGVKLKDGAMKFEIDSELIAKLGAEVNVYADLLVTTINIWSHKWDLAEKKWKIALFGDGEFTIPLPIGNDGKIGLTPGGVESNLDKLKGAVNQDNIADRSEKFMDGQGTTDEDKQHQASSVIKKEVIARFTDPARFEFNKSVDYLRTRYELVDYLRSKAQLEKNIDLSYIEDEIKKAEFEEYEKFGPYIQKETFDADTKYLIIDDFITNHPTLGETERVNLKSLVVPDKKKTAQRKEIDSSPVIQLSPAPVAPESLDSQKSPDPRESVELLESTQSPEPAQSSASSQSPESIQSPESVIADETDPAVADRTDPAVGPTANTQVPGSNPLKKVPDTLAARPDPTSQPGPATSSKDSTPAAAPPSSAPTTPGNDSQGLPALAPRGTPTPQLLTALALAASTGTSSRPSISSKIPPSEDHPALSALILNIDKAQQQLTLSAEQQRTQLLTQATAHIQSVHDTVDQEVMSLEQSFDLTIAQVESAASNTEMTILTQRDVQIAGVENHSTIGILNLLTATVTQQKALSRASNASGDAAIQQGEAQAQRATSESSTKAGQALAIGERGVKRYRYYDRSSRIASASREMASELASRYIEAGAQLALSARMDSGKMADKFMDESDDAANKFAGGQISAIAKIGELRDQTVEALTQIAQAPLGSLNEAADLIVQQLQAQKEQASTRIRQIGAALERALASQAALALTMIGTETDNAFDQLDDFGGQLSKLFEKRSPSPRQVAEVNKLVGQTPAEFDAQLTAFTTGMNKSLELSSTAGEQNIARRVNGLTSQANETGLRFEASAVASATEVVQSMTNASQKTEQNMDTVVTETEKTFADVVAQSTAEWSKDQVSGIAEITSRMTTGLEKMDESLADLLPQIDEKAEKIENQGWLSRALSWIAGIVVSIFEKLWDFVVTLLEVLLAVLVAVVLIIVVILLIGGLDLLLAVVLTVAALAFAFAEVIADILAIAAGIMVLLGVISLIKGIYQAATRDDLSDYDRGKLVGAGLFDFTAAVFGEKLFAKLGEWLKETSAWFRSLGEGIDLGEDAANLAKLRSIITDENQLQRLLTAFGNDPDRLEKIVGIFSNDGTRLETTLGFFGEDAAALEKTLARFGNDPARLENALSRFGNNGPDLEQALTKCGEDASLLERLLNDKKIADIKQLQSLLDNYSGVQLEVLLKDPVVPDGAHLERLVNALKDGGFGNALTGGLQTQELARFASAGILPEIENAAALSKAGKIKGLPDWLTFNAAKDLPQLTDSLGELREAERLVTENPNSVIGVGQEAHAPVKPGTTDPAPEFDITVGDAAGKTSQSTEFTSVQNRVSQVSDLTNGVRHAADKVASRAALGIPLQGRLEATIQMTLDVGKSPRGGTIVEILPDSTVNVIRPSDNAIVRTNNIFDQFTNNLSRIANNQQLDVVNLVDAGGKLLASFERTASGWIRTH